MRNESSVRDFGELRCMLVDAEEYSSSLFKSAAASVGLHNIAVFQSAKAVLANIRVAGPPDLLFVKFTSVDPGSIRLCRFIRDRAAFPHPFIPIVAVVEHATKAAVTAVRDAGVDEFLACPYSPKTLSQRIRSIVADRRGFVDVPGYFGPDRRRGAMARFLGAERRSDPTELIDPLTEQVYTG